MKSREIVKKTLEFDSPQRVARSFEPSDIVFGGYQTFGDVDLKWREVNPGVWQRNDEWGNTWERVDESSKGEIVEGTLKNIDDVSSMPLPDFSNPEIYKPTADLFQANPDKWCIGGVQGFAFSMARKLRRLDQYFMDLMTEHEKITILHDRIDRQIKFQFEGFKNAGADSVMIWEDWGTQSQLFISPELWRKEFKPRFTALCRYAHYLDLKMFMHSCGKITDIVPDLIECGVDLFQFDQPTLHGIDTLQKFQEQSQITFWCPVDIQMTLQSEDEETIRREARELIEKLWRGQGGFIAGYYEDNQSIGLDPKWQAIAADEFVKSGVNMC